MKRSNQFLKQSVLVMGFAIVSMLLTLTLQSCNNTKKDSKEIAEDQNDDKFTNTKEDDAEFLVNAAEINLEEIELGRLAQNQGNTSQVKDFGKMMETDHSKAFTDLQALAASKQISIPTTITEDGIEAQRKLRDTKASDFDKDYIDKMVNGHKDAIDKFEKASNDANDPDIRNWAGSLLPTFRQHLDQLIIYQNQLGNK